MDSKNDLGEVKRMRHKFVSGQIGVGYTTRGLSNKTFTRYTKEGILFKQGELEMILTKEELLNEFKICLDTGFIKKEELFD